VVVARKVVAVVAVVAAAVEVVATRVVDGVVREVDAGTVVAAAAVVVTETSVAGPIVLEWRDYPSMMTIRMVRAERSKTPRLTGFPPR